ncbi:MAG: barstar family protein [Proteobacteria bacterium]|nr:barstar family protein [Pseudomonadota bacterium]
MTPTTPATPSPLQQLLSRASRAGIYHLPDGLRRNLPDTCAGIGFSLLSCDLRETTAIGTALRTLGEDLDFPEWYGANFDALADCLTDLSWNDAPGYVLTIHGADALHAADPAAFATLNAVFAEVIGEWTQRNIPFWVFYDLRADGLAPLPTLA